MAYKTQTFDQDLQILARAEGLRSPRHITLDPATFSADATGKKYAAPGHFVGLTPTGFGRILPRTRLITNAATGVTVLPVKTSAAFVVGDEIKTLTPTGIVTIASSTTGWAPGDTITITIGGMAVTYTVVAADIAGTLTATNALVATKVALALNTEADNLVDATSSASVIVISAADGKTLYTLTAADTATNGTATAGSAALSTNTTIGTVLSVQVDAKTITLSAPTTSALYAGQNIGSVSKPLGLLATGLDLSYDHLEQGLFVSASVYGERLPYFDGELAALFPEIVLV